MERGGQGGQALSPGDNNGKPWSLPWFPAALAKTHPDERGTVPGGNVSGGGNPTQAGMPVPRRKVRARTIERRRPVVACDM